MKLLIRGQQKIWTNGSVVVFPRLFPLVELILGGIVWFIVEKKLIIGNNETFLFSELF